MSNDAIIVNPIDGNRQLSLFDYASLDPETRIVVQQRTKELREKQVEFARLARLTAEQIWLIGYDLADVQGRLASFGYGTFTKWLETEFPEWSQRTAYNFIAVSQRFVLANFAKTTIATSALYLLAAPSTTDEAFDDAIERAESGETITHSKARQIVEAHTALAAAALDTPTPPTLAVNAAKDVIQEAQATNGYVTTRDGDQVEADETTLLEATLANYEERAARQSQHIQDGMTKKAYKNSSDSNEWYTPPELVAKAYQVMGGIDLDPATSAAANRIVQASEFFTADTDGLHQDWFGRVWLNPPYGDAVGEWVDKLLGEYEAGHVQEAILLVAARTDTQWFRKLRKCPRCFLWGRIKFINGNTGEIGDPAGFPSMVVYMGGQFSQFVSTFEDIGDTYVLWQM